MRRLVIVESPTKATKIASYLGSDYIVDSSRGHVRDLPQSASEVPAKYKGEKWARTGVDVDNDFKPLYVVASDKRATIRQLKAELAECSELYLATDEDREGEAIAWHLIQELKPKVPVRRMVFHEITPQAIQHAVEHPRELDLDLVDAQETRRILDRLYGYEVSPVLWKKVKPKLSAGRVQSVATRLVVDRERERIAFISANYWDLTATIDAGDATPRFFPAKLTTIDDQRVAQGRDFNADGQLTTKNAIALGEGSAKALAEAIKTSPIRVLSVEAKPYTRRPYPPFRTTTLQQEAGRKLGFSASRTMSIAQELYERGFITYMRTDSVNLSSQAIVAARNQIENLYGANFLSPKPRVYTTKVKNAQEAHEAIRPAGSVFQTPAQTGLVGDQFKIYELIWKRTLASQMADAKGETVSVKLQSNFDFPIPVLNTATGEEANYQSAVLGASGRTITFPGFLKAYVESIDEGASDDSQVPLPPLSESTKVEVDQVEPEGHETRPPARYTEPSLVARLEELEIGRPSTYASIIRTITTRDYVYKRGQALVPTWLAFGVTRLLEEHFPKLVDYAFTASMEEALDEIATGDENRLDVLNSFYFGGGHMSAGSDDEGLRDLVEDLGDIDARAISTFAIGDLDSDIVVRVGRYGTYLEDAELNRANVPDDLPPDELTLDKAKELLEASSHDGRELGLDPQTHLPIVVKNGRFGPYVTEVLDENAPKGTKPRTASLFKSMNIETVELDDALKLLSLPRVVGQDAEGVEITAQNGRYGPYLKKGTDSRSLATEEELFTITLEQAEAIFAQPKTRGRRAAAAPLRELGTDPVSGNPVVVKDGRFGPYVTDGEYNATLRQVDSIDSITLERAAELLVERRAKGPAKRAKKTTAKKTAAKKTAAKKTTAKKTAAKKTAAKKTTAKKAAVKKTTTKQTSAKTT